MKYFKSFHSILIFIICVCNIGTVNATPRISDTVERVNTILSIDSIKDSYELLMQREKFDDLVRNQEKVIGLSLKIYDPNGPEIAEENHWMGYFLSKCNNYSDAIRYVTESANAYNILGSKYLEEYFDVLNKIALYNYCNNDVVAALDAYTHILEEFNNKKAIIIELYVEALSKALNISNQNELPVSLENYLDFLSDSSIEDEVKLALYSNVIIYFINKNSHSNAIEIYNSAEAIIIRKPEYRSNEIWGDILLNVVNAYTSIGDYDEALSKLKQAEGVYNYAGKSINLFYVYSSLGMIKHLQDEVHQAEPKAPDTCGLMFKTLSNLGCQPKVDDDGILTVQYQGENFNMVFGGVYVRVWDPMWSGVKADDPDLPKIREAVNSANFNFGPTVVMTAPDEHGVVGLHSRRDIMLHPACPDNEPFVKAVLDSFFEAKEQVRSSYQQINAKQAEMAKSRRPVGFTTNSQE